MAKTYYTIQGDMWDGIAKKLYDDESGSKRAAGSKSAIC